MKFDLFFCYFPLIRFPPCPQARQTARKAFVCLRASVNPFCQVSAEPFLSKLPAWSLSLLCWWEKLEEKACGTPAAPRLGLGSSARKDRAWDLVLARALCGSCDWRFNRRSPGRPSATPHSLSHLGNGGRKRQLHTYSAASHSQSVNNPAALMHGRLPKL